MHDTQTFVQRNTYNKILKPYIIRNRGHVINDTYLKLNPINETNSFETQKPTDHIPLCFSQPLHIL